MTQEIKTCSKVVLGSFSSVKKDSLVPSLTLMWFLAGLSVFSWSGCQKDEIQGAAEIDEELMEYFEIFRQEGVQRGLQVDFDKNPVSGYISETLSSGISGQCQHDTENPDRLLVNSQFWRRASAMEREFLVFHELGHCYLKRSHLDQKKQDGTCVSMMHSGAGACQNDYSKETRQSYLDELFNPD